MAISIVIMNRSGEAEQSPFVLLDLELMEYLSQLELLPAIQKLGSLDIYDNTTLSDSLREQLLQELSQLDVLVAESKLPTPPDHVGLEGPGDPSRGEAFGWAGLSTFGKQLNAVLENALSKDAEVVAVGD